MNDQNFPSETPYGTGPGVDEPKKGGWFSGCIWGCGITSLVMLLLCGGGGLYVYTNFRTFAADFAEQAVDQALEEAQIPAEEKESIRSDLNRMISGYRAGEVSNEDLQKGLTKFTESPLFELVVIQGIEEKYIKPSGLSEEEKAEAQRTIQRLLRGGAEGLISREELEPLSKHFLVGPEDNQQMKQSMTDEEVRAMLDDAKQLVDEAGVPDGEYDFDISSEVRQIVDSVMGSAAGNDAESQDGEASPDAETSSADESTSEESSADPQAAEETVDSN